MDDDPIEVIEPTTKEEITVVAEGKTHLVTSKQSVEVLPDVYLSAGEPQSRKMKKRNSSIPRIMIEAPSDKVILREELYEQQRA